MPTSEQASKLASKQGGLENVEVCRIGGMEACRLDARRVWWVSGLEEVQDWWLEIGGLGE